MKISIKKPHTVQVRHLSPLQQLDFLCFLGIWLGGASMQPLPQNKEAAWRSHCYTCLSSHPGTDSSEFWAPAAPQKPLCCKSRQLSHRDSSNGSGTSCRAALICVYQTELPHVRALSSAFTSSLLFKQRFCSPLILIMTAQFAVLPPPMKAKINSSERLLPNVHAPRWEFLKSFVSSK